MLYSKKVLIVEESKAAPLDQAASNTPISRLQEFLDEALRAKPTLRLLDAGCGSVGHFRFPGKQVHITGIDISQEQLERNRNLDVRIQADIQTYAYQPSSYDVIICWWVLEHLPRPDLALRGFALALDEGGLIVLGVPNVLSVKGLLAKYMPFPVHIWVYRHMHGGKTSGKKNPGPFPTYLRYSTRPNAIRRFADRNGLQVVYLATSDVLGSPGYFQGSKFARGVRVMYRGVKALAKVVTVGLLGDSEFVMALQKRS